MSETAAGKGWLSNFAPADVPAASILLDSVRFVSLTTMHLGLTTYLGNLVATGALAPPAMIIPERRFSDFSLPSGRTEETAVAFEDFEPGAPLKVTPGSDGFVAMMLTELAKSRSSEGQRTWIPPNADIERLRSERCRSIVLVTDYAGSGSQVLKLASAITRHRTIRSWRSMNLLKIHVVAFAAAPSALERLRSNKTIDYAHAVESAPDFASAIWGKEERAEIDRLCRTECRINPDLALGWGESGGLFATERRAPNNMPAVFIQTKGRWQALFPGRRVSADIAAQLVDIRPVAQLHEAALRVGQRRIGQNNRIDSMPETSKTLLTALLLCSERPRTPDMLASEIGIDIDHAVGILESLERLGLIDAERCITGAGRSELAAHKRRRRRTTAEISGSDATYYPLSLR